MGHVQRKLEQFSAMARAAAAKIACVIFATLLVSGCAATRGGPIPYEAPNFGAPDAPRPTIIGEGYRISTGDKLLITVYQVEDLSREYTVDLSGNVAIPLIGSVPAVGRTTAELRNVIAQRLGERYLRNPDVTVGVTESTNNNVTVEGGVRQPGVYPLTGASTLIQAIAQARGIDPQGGNPRRIAIFRRIDGQRMAAAFDLVGIRNGEMQDPEIYPGDVVVVQSDTRRTFLQEILGTLPILALFRPY